MIICTQARTDQDLTGILKLQKMNLPQSLTPEEISSQGFVTIVHSFADLRKLNDIEPHIIAKEGETVVAYLLAMTAQSQFDIPVLKPMFVLFGQVSFAGKVVSDYRYIVVGQVCVDKKHRGKGILDDCYRYYKETLQQKYGFAITEIAATNLRSLNAHKRIGFQEVHRYTAPDNVEWVIVLWDWNNLA